MTEQFLQGALPMAVLSLDGVVQVVNAACERLAGRPASELVGTSVLDLVADADRAAAVETLASVQAGHVVGNTTQRLRTAGGELLDVQVAWTLVRAGGEGAAHLTIALVDVTHAQRQSAELARTAARFRASFQQSPLPQVLVGLDGRMSDVNAALAVLLGRTREELTGRSLLELVHDSTSGPAGNLAALLAGEVDGVRYERVLSDAAGRPVPVLVDAVLLRDEAGAPLEATLVMQDLRMLRDLEARREQQEQFFLAISQRATDLALVADVEGRIVYVSPAVRSVLGYDALDLVGADGWEFVHQDDQEATREAYAHVVEHGGSRSFAFRMRIAEGGWNWIEVTATNLLDTAVGGIVCNLRDITERVEAERALRASEARYRTIADTAQEGIWAVATDGSTLYANARMAQMLGRPLEELYARPAAALLDPNGTAGVARRLAAVDPAPESYEISYLRPDGEQRQLWIAASPLPGPDGGVEGLLGMVSDVTHVRRAEEQLRRAALHDALTGLPNRTLLQDRLEQVLTRQSAAQGPGYSAVLLLDLDDFKAVNDTRGHGTGDSLLVAVAERLRKAARPVDTVARLGGDEFVVVCEDVDEAGARQVAEDLVAALHRPFEVDGSLLHVDASVGVAMTEGSSGADLIRFADAAMYQAKSAGRGRVVLFDRTHAEQVEARYALAADLRVAVDRDQLRVHYQPVIELATGAVVGVEALTRWRHDALGDVPPQQFVDVAEQTGLAVQLDTWALRRALLETAGLRRGGLLGEHVTVAVNLSARTLVAPQLEQTLVEAAAAAGTPPDRVTLEITESAVMHDADRAVEVLARLRQRGFGVAVDDFGTGYSSLAYLRDLPLTQIKIDRSFVAGIADDRDALAIVASIVDLARAIDVTAVAEGVETAEQAALLRRLGCAHGQGWLWSPAVAPEQVAEAAPTWRAGYPTGTASPRVVHKEPERWEVLPEHGGDRLLQLHREGASLTTIAAALNGEGFRTPAGARWHRTTVARTIAQAAYPGLSPSGEAPGLS